MTRVIVRVETEKGDHIWSSRVHELNSDEVWGLCEELHEYLDDVFGEVDDKE